MIEREGGVILFTLIRISIWREPYEKFNFAINGKRARQINTLDRLTVIRADKNCVNGYIIAPPTASIATPQLPNPCLHSVTSHNPCIRVLDLTTDEYLTFRSRPIPKAVHTRACI